MEDKKVLQIVPCAWVMKLSLSVVQSKWPVIRARFKRVFWLSIREMVRLNKCWEVVGCDLSSECALGCGGKGERQGVSYVGRSHC